MERYWCECNSEHNAKCLLHNRMDFCVSQVGLNKAMPYPPLLDLEGQILFQQAKNISPQLEMLLSFTFLSYWHGKLESGGCGKQGEERQNDLGRTWGSSEFHCFLEQIRDLSIQCIPPHCQLKFLPLFDYKWRLSALNLLPLSLFLFLRILHPFLLLPISVTQVTLH